MRKLICLICAAVLLLPHTAAVSAQSAVVLDGLTGECLYAKNADVQLPMASTTKIMTAITAIEMGDLDRVYTVKREYTLVEGSSMYLREGEAITLRETLYGLMLMSGNDAALAVAGECGGQEAFVAAMNEKARMLGLPHTHFDNPNGLDGETHYTTARELARLTAYAMQNDTFCEIVSTEHHAAGGRTMVNHNKLLRMYEDAVGVKTGFTKRAGRCLVSAAERDGRRLIAVTLNAPDDWNDHMELLDNAFAAYKQETLAESGETVCTVPVQSGWLREIGLTADETVTLSLTADELERLETVRRGRHFLYAPIEKGEPCGELVWLLDGKVVARVGLTAAETSAQLEETVSFWERLFAWLPFV
ncbi:MAG: D-alanyl-D-alanine carboxypeptidase [Butyricicoccus sp.]|nr:D-alanyl-D-alanine carboxypeptidase [Butyricicoccus sp.]